MIAPAKQVRPRRRVPAWHAGFLAMVPIIHEYARGAFSRCNPEAQQDLIQEVIANALVAYVRLFQRGRISLAYPTVLARYGIAQVKDGRRVGNKLRIGEVLSPYAQQRKKFSVDSLDKFDAEEDSWKEIVIEDRRVGPDQVVATKLDFAAWLCSLPRRNRRIAQFLAVGNRTVEASRKFKLSEGRISQVRRELQKAWAEFTSELEPSPAAVPA